MHAPATANPTSLSEVLERTEKLEAELCKRSLLLFIERVWSIIEPDNPYHHNWHIELICADLEALTRGECDREVFNIPPGTMKSLVMVIWQAWMWADNPSLRFFRASYSDHLSIRDNVKLRSIVESAWYQKHYKVELVEDQKTQLRTSAGGWSVASSVGGAATGEHPNYIVIDDPITALQARSEAERERANTWFDSTISSRGVILNVRVAIVMQRLHQNDLTGYLKAKDPRLKMLVLPMRYEPSRPKSDKDPGYTAEPRDPRTEPGELLWPLVFTEAKVCKLELDLGPYDTAGQLQQHPAPEGGGLFKREWFKYVDVAPKTARRVRGWDTGATEAGGDPTCGVKISEPPGKVDDDGVLQGCGTFYVEDVAWGQLSPAGVDRLIEDTAKSDGIGTSVRELREGGSAGKTVTSARLKSLKGYDYAEVVVNKDKVTLSKPFRAQVEGGNVYLVRGDWNEAYIRELCDFPTGNHDDRVDGSSCSFNALLLEPVPSEDWVTW